MTLAEMRRVLDESIDRALAMVPTYAEARALDYIKAEGLGTYHAHDEDGLVSVYGGSTLLFRCTPEEWTALVEMPHSCTLTEKRRFHRGSGPYRREQPR